MSEWKTAGIVFLAGLAAIAAWWIFVVESDAERTSRLHAEFDTETKRKVAHLSDAGHPNAKILVDEALRTCKRAIRSHARDPETAVIPDVGWMTGGADWRFFWTQNTRMVRMRNGVGLEVAVTAGCVVDEVSGDVRLLQLDGRQLIDLGAR